MLSYAWHVITLLSFSRLFCPVSGQTCGVPKSKDPMQLGLQFNRPSTTRSTTVAPFKTPKPTYLSSAHLEHKRVQFDPFQEVHHARHFSNGTLPSSTIHRTPYHRGNARIDQDRNVFRSGVPQEYRFLRLSDPKNKYASGRWKRQLRANKIVGGFYVNDLTGGQICWQIMLLLNGRFHCGGSIVGQRTIITAGHCVYSDNALVSKENITILTGVLSHNRETDAVPLVLNCGRSFGVAAIVVHPSFVQDNTFNHDIAMIQLTEDIKFNGSCTCPICVENREPVVGEICANSGYGETLDGRHVVPLKWVRLQVLENNESNCAVLNGTNTDLFVCAGNVLGEGSCFGDSGGALVCWDPTRLNSYYLAGVVSHGRIERCGSAGIGTQYTKIARYVDWIRQNSARLSTK